MPNSRNTKKGFIVIRGIPGDDFFSKFYATEEEADFVAKRLLDRDETSTVPVFVVQAIQYTYRQNAGQVARIGQTDDQKFEVNGDHRLDS